MAYKLFACMQLHNPTLMEGGHFNQMDERTLRLLELSKVLDMLTAHTSTQMGKELALMLKPSTDTSEVKLRQRATTAVRHWWDKYGMPPLSAVRDIRKEMERATTGDVLEPSELLAIASSLSAAMEVKDFLVDAGELPDCLAQHVNRINDHTELVRAIRRCLDEEGNVVDGATNKLQRIRHQLKVLRNRIVRKLQSMLSDTRIQQMLQEAIITIRNGRYCLPVRASHKHAFKGIVHDKSSSGMTFFVEPEEVVGLGNELRELQVDEEREVQRILRELSEHVTASSEAIGETLDAIAHIDLLFALARFGAALHATEPELNADGVIQLRRARHPLLGESAVPINVRMGDDFDVLIITGPNTGGKTVTLKTIGLLTLMAQCGMHVPAAEGSQICIFEKIFADIGDEQSIEQNLSTFSSHIVHIADMIPQADERTLILLDEIGAGTDPEEGASLAKALLLELHRRGAKVACTTHFGELKTFAYSEPRFENAAVLFDPDTLRPTYQLVIGTPGRSHAFVIAHRLGLPDEVIAQAHKMRERQAVEWEEALARVERKRQALERERMQLMRERRELEQLRGQYERELAELQNQREAIIAQARTEAQNLLQRVQREVEQILRTIRQQTRESVITERARQQLRALQQTVTPPSTHVQEERALPSVGATVYLPRVRVYGVVVDRKDKTGELLVEADGMRVWVSAAEVHEATPAHEERDVEVPASLRLRKMTHVPSELNIIGKTVDEALPLVDKFLDDAVLAGYARVCVIHGRGTGTLRQAVREFLKRHPHVASFHPAPAREGGNGATVVKLKSL
ncbi:TPA: endonuclease MutS2 [Candidatus Bipolaricaulota bacterium]|nr:endonuclease MutS2 [Candidatus Bipolaricaulota bacterium]